jgi:hypothetical protein
MQGDDSATSAVALTLPHMDTQFTPHLALLVAAPSMLVAIERGATLGTGGPTGRRADPELRRFVSAAEQPKHQP